MQFCRKLISNFFVLFSGWPFSCCYTIRKKQHTYFPKNKTIKEMKTKNNIEVSSNKVNSKKHDAIKIQLNSVTFLEVPDGNMITNDSETII